MTTCVVVRKDDQIAIAADSLVTFGDTRLSQAYEANEKIIEVNGSYVSLSGTTAHFPVMKKLLTEMGDDCRLGSRDEVFDTFTRVHQVLKDKYFLNVKEEEDDPYESSQITTLIANPHGIFGVYSMREVFEYTQFWAAGSGREFALGAMLALYPKLRTAEAIARAGVEAGATFDRNSALPLTVYTIPIGGAPDRTA